MKKAKEAKRFARMFVNITGMDNVPDGIKQLGALNAVMLKSKKFKTFFRNPSFTTPERLAVLNNIKGTLGLSENTIKFVGHLSDAGAASFLSEIIRYATNIYLEKKKRAKATVITPVQMDRGYEERLRASIGKLTGREIDIEYELDPSLLGGVLVKVGSTMFDSSIRGQLRLLKDELIKE